MTQFSIVTPGTVLLVLIAVEAIISYLHEKDEHEIKDTMANITIGFANFGMNIFSKSASFALLVYLQQFQAMPMENTWWVYILLFLFADFIHFIMHYLEHKVDFLWAIHSMHHSSQHYNLSVALRNPLTNSLYRLLYEIPLCIIGFQASAIMAVDLVILIYGALIHTSLVNKLGIFERILNTPSHHRVHHGVNDQYIDKNFGTVLIIWDKLFHTFEPETEKPVYGTAEPVHTINPLVIVLTEPIKLYRKYISSIKTSAASFFKACDGLLKTQTAADTL